MNLNAMNSEPDEFERQIADALEDFRDGNLNDQDLQQLRQLISQNADARKIFAKHNLLSHLLTSKFSSPALEHSTPNIPAEASAIDAASGSSPLSKSSGSRAGNGLPKRSNTAAEKKTFLPIRWLGPLLAASLLIASTLMFLPSQKTDAPTVAERSPATPADIENSSTDEAVAAVDVDDQPNTLVASGPKSAFRPASSESPIAVLLESTDARWKKAAPATGGVPLRRGWMELLSGTAAVRFNSGAVVTLIGQTRFQLIDPMHSFQASGSAVVSVPPQAKGFQIRTSAMNVTDLGTEFAVRVGADKEADVHVITGLVEVDCETSTAANTRERFEISEDKAKRFVERSKPAELEIDRSFRKQIFANRPSQRIGYYTFDTYDDDSGVSKPNPSAVSVGGNDVRFRDFTFVGVQPGPEVFKANLNRWAFKGWTPKYQGQKRYVGFKVAAEEGKSLQLNRLSLELFRSTGELARDLAPQDGIVRISADGFKTFKRFVLMDGENFVTKPKFISNDLRKIAPATEYEFRFMFKGQTKARAIRLDEVTLDLDVLPASFAE